MAGGTLADRREAVRLRLQTDYIYGCEKMIKIVPKFGPAIPFTLKRPQKRLARALMAQRDAGQPQRAIALKARQVGVSTLSEAIMMLRVAQQANHLALVLAQDRKTAGKLFKMGEFAWANLPAELKPTVARKADTEDRKYMVFGEASHALRRRGLLGLNSSLEISTSKGLAGRGLTPRSLHISEYAWWEQGDAILGVINGVPDDPDSFIVMESTAKGHNHFKDEWDLAVSGESGYYPFFSPWFEEEDYRRPFANELDMLEFEQSVGHHPRWGEDEPVLVALITESYRSWADEEGFVYEEEFLRQRVLEHLNWRRWAIASKCQGKLERFKQEYPATPDEAFLSTGNRVYDPQLVAQVIKHCEKISDPPMPTAGTPGPWPGLLRVETTKPGMDRSKTKIKVPTAAVWVPAARRDHDEVPRWRMWSAPQKARPADGDYPGHPDGQYIIFCDPSSGKTDEKGVTHAETAIQVIDHRTRKQVAEWRGQIDPDLVALELIMAALYYNGAWVAVEVTGGYGLSMVSKLAIDWKYARTYEEQSRDKRITDRTERLGWHTDAVSKPLMEAALTELLRVWCERPETMGIQSLTLARQMLTFIRDDRGRTKPEAGKLSDLLMAFMGAQAIARARPIRPDRAQQSRGKKKPAPKRRPRNERTGY